MKTARNLDPDRTRRHQVILELLQSKEFRSQTDVANALVRSGFKVTQASISRDFQELGVIKSRGCYRIESALGSSIESSITTVSAGEHLLVVHTPIGGANAVAIRIDRQSLPGVLGTVAGDDTIFVATKNRAAHKLVARLLATSF